MGIDKGAKPSFFDIEYGIASPAISTDGVSAIVTGSANYFGFTLLAGSSAAKAIIYDSVNTGAGSVIDIIYADTTQFAQSRDIKVRARLGISVSITGTDMEGAIFYAPQG